MNGFYTALFGAGIALSAIGNAAAQCSNCNTTYNSSVSNLNVTVPNGQTYCIVSGANIQNSSFTVASGGTLCISGGSYSNGNLTINNGGTLNVGTNSLPNNIIYGTTANVIVQSGITYAFQNGAFGGTLTNSGTLNFGSGATLSGTINNTTGTLNFAGTCGGIINNAANSTANISGSSNAGAAINNSGTAVLTSFNAANGAIAISNATAGYLTFQNGFSMTASGSIFTNLGNASSTADFSTGANNTIVVNRGYFKINGNFNCADSLGNYGLLNCNNFFNGNGTRVYNYCRLLTFNGTNPSSGHFYNNSLFWVTGTSPAKLQVNGGTTLTGGPNATFRTPDFTNSGTVNGYGSYYATGATLNQSAFTGTSAATPILFYDASQTGSQIFDQQPTIATNTNRPATMTAPDTTASFNNCSDANFLVLAHNYNPGVPLPVVLLAFTARWNEQQQGTTDWATATENNTARFVVERSYDGLTFSNAGTVQARGLASGYHWVDAGQSLATCYYRLRIEDLNGSFTYSGTQRLAGFSTAAFSDAVVSPVPFKETLSVQIQSIAGGMATITMLDVFGRIMRSQVVQLHEGDNSVDWSNMGGYAPGTYYLRILAEGKLQTLHIVK